MQIKDISFITPNNIIVVYITRITVNCQCTLISSVMLVEKYYYPWFRDVKSAFTLFPLIIQESVHRTEGTSSRG